MTRIELGPENDRFKNEATLFFYQGKKDTAIMIDIGLSSAPESYDTNYVAYLEVIDSMEYSVQQRHFKREGLLE